MKRRLLVLLLALLCLTGCGGNAGGTKSLTEGLKSNPPVSQPLTEESAAALTDFSLELLRKTWNGENILVSPLSVLSALGMTANGAEGETLSQMEAVLGLPAEELNAALASWAGNLPKEKRCRVDLANSLWLRDDGSFQANREFLQTMADWYGAEMFASQFNGAAVKDVNSWVKKNTHGMIDSILDEIPDSAVLYLINALALEAEWETVYRKDQVWDGRVFTTEDGREQPVTLMYSSEDYYLEDGHAQGFLKHYKGGRWAFAALLPEEGVKLEDYIDSLDGERLYEILTGVQETLVEAAVPKFQYEHSAELSDSLKAMGMTDAFDVGSADLSGLGVSELGPLFISRVIHKTYIAVDEKGTKAGAATAVEADSGASAPGSVPAVHLDRPFLYMLVDRSANLPAFIGTVTSME